MTMTTATRNSPVRRKQSGSKPVPTFPAPRTRTIAGGATLDSALEALQANRLRSFLTMLGVIIGVSAVIAVVTLTQGVNKSVNDRFAGLGTNVLTISPGTTSSFGARAAAGSSQTLTVADALTQVAHVLNVSPILGVSAQVIYQDQNWNTTVRGVYPDFQTIQNWQVAEGNWFSDQDEQTGAPVAVLGQTVIANLFPTGTVDPLGQIIRVGSQSFRVIGVLQAKGSQGTANADDVIFVPFTAANNRLKPSLYVNQIQVQIDDISNVTQAQLDITALLRTRHHLSGPDPSLQQSASATRQTFTLGGGNPGAGQGNRGGFSGQGGGRNGGTTSASSTRSGTRTRAVTNPPNDFQILNVNQLIQTAQQNSAILTILLIGIAAISLAIGGIGIMNIMLVSVTERIREIGIRMAVGARRRDIRNQFLLEAVMLSTIGGVMGIMLGLGGGLALTVGLGLPFVLSPTPALIAFTVSATVGIVFGLYPAVRAARLDPITALHTE